VPQHWGFLPTSIHGRRYNDADLNFSSFGPKIMSTKTILAAALKLPARSRARLAGKLLDSLDEPVWDEAIVAGAKVADERLRRLHADKTKGIPEERAHRQLFGK
jgi:hypothetical protein